jgi:hypothetical protein
LSISSAREQFKNYKNNFKLPSNFNSEEFRLIANGFFQAEGHISCRIKGNYFIPVFVVNQNLSAESLEFFLTLWHVLGRTGTLSIVKNKYEKLIIRLSSESWDTIINSYSKYFNNIYGEKYIAFKKLFDIRRLTSKELKLDLNSLAIATHIVYDISDDLVTRRKLSLSDQLSLLNLKSINVELPIYTDNFTPLSIFFILGFFIGDGTFHLRVRKSDKGSIWLIPTLFLPQLKNKYNAQFLIMLEKFFKSFDIKTYIINKSTNDPEIVDILKKYQKKNIKKMKILTIESFNSIFETLIPVLRPYSHYLYWKFYQFEIMDKVARLVKGKAHYTLYGFETIVEIIYSYPNKRLNPKEF